MTPKKFSIGDRLRVTDPSGARYSARRGDLVTVQRYKDFDSYDAAWLVEVKRESDGLVYAMFERRFERAPKPFAVGDRVRVIKAGPHSVKIGSIGTVKRVSGHYIVCTFDASAHVSGAFARPFDNTLIESEIEHAPQIIPNPRGSIVYVTGTDATHDADAGTAFFAVGTEVEIIETCVCGENPPHFRVKDTATDRKGYVAEADLDVVKPAPLSPFKPGDLVRVKGYAAVNGIRPNTRAKVVNVSGDRVTLTDDGTNNCGFVFGGLKTVPASALEPRRENRRDQGYLPKIGDYVKVTAAQGSWRYSDVRGKVKSTSAGQTFDGSLHDYEIEVDYVDGERQIFPYVIHAITVEKSEQPARVAFKAWADEFFEFPAALKTFKVGDKVKVLDDGNANGCLHYAKIGAIGTVVGPAPFSPERVRVEFPRSAWTEYGSPGMYSARTFRQVVPVVSLELVAPVPAFKVGDLVKVIEARHLPEVTGSLARIESIRPDTYFGDYRVRQIGGKWDGQTYRASKIEHAPAPSNADKAAALVKEIEDLREKAYDSSEALDDKVDEALAFLKEIAK